MSDVYKMDTLFNHPDFQKLDPKKQKMVSLLANSLQNKKLTEALPYLMQWKEQMKEENISFTKEENDLLTEILMQEMTPAQRKQYEYLKLFIKN